MAGARSIVLSFVSSLMLAGPMLAQAPGQLAPPAKADAVAATVNGQPIPEHFIQRTVKRVPKERQAEARSDILQYLIDNVLINQYLLQLKIEVAPEEVKAKIEEIRADIKKEKQTFEGALQALGLTEQELGAELTAELRWERFLHTQATEKNLQEVFQKSPEMFDGSMVRARHILLTPPSGDLQAGEQAKQKLLRFKKEVEGCAARAVAALPPDADNLKREKVLAQALEESFSDLARKESACPSKDQGGDVGWFPRSGSMVEPFARVAFALKTGTMSDMVQTQFGYHLILATDRKPGKETKFQEVIDFVREVYGYKVREAICAQLRPQAKIIINEPAKP